MGSCPSTCFTSKHDTHARRAVDGTDAWSDCHDCYENIVSAYRVGFRLSMPPPSSSLKVARGSEDSFGDCMHPLATLDPC